MMSASCCRTRVDNMAKRSQKEVERFLTREFLTFMGFRMIRIRSSENPDVFASLRKRGKKLHVGIELTNYQVDAPPSAKFGSPMFGLERLWCKVQTSIRRRIAKRPKLWHTSGLVFLKDEKVPKGRIAQDLAEELVRLALAHSVRKRERVWITRFCDEYPLLQKHVRRVNLHGTGCALPRCTLSHILFPDFASKQSVLGIMEPVSVIMYLS